MANGIKYDKDKPLLAEMLLDFKEPLLELCKVWTFGKDKYGKSNWKELDDAENRYLNALYRHSFKAIDNEFDDETGLLHAAHIAFNALAYLFFVIKRHKQNSPKTNQEM